MKTKREKRMVLKGNFAEVSGNVNVAMSGLVNRMKSQMEGVLTRAFTKEAGIDGILVTVGLCIIALLLCVVMKDSLTEFIEGIVDSMRTKATTILNGV